VDGNSWYWTPPTPGLAVLDVVGEVHDVRADGTRRVARQDVLSRQCWNPDVYRNVHLLGKEERQVARKGGLHAVCPLIQENTVPTANHRTTFVQAEREAGAWGQAHGARIEQAASPIGLLRGHVWNRQERQQALSRRIDVAVLIAGNHETAARYRQIDRGQPVVHVVHVLVVLVPQARVQRQVIADVPVVLSIEVQPVRTTVFVSAADAGRRRRGIAKEEIGKRVARELSSVGKRTSRVVGLVRAEP
jgi:hypothetical protein